MSEVFDPEKVERFDMTDRHKMECPQEFVAASDYDSLLALYREATKKEVEYAWQCNECGSDEFTDSVGADDFEDDAMSCTNCGGTEFHRVQKPTIP